MVRLLFILFLPISTLFGNGGFKGSVIDSLSGKPLFGANVVLLNTAFGSSTDFDGKFIVRNIPAGEYEVKCSYIGYQPKIIDIEITDNRILQIDFKLKIDAIEGETVLITAQAEGQAAAINQQLSSNTITNVVSADKILEIPDANAAESVGRLPGISILREGGEGNKITIRGLAPTYNSVTIGGNKIPATDLDDRSVDLSMISPEILAGIEVTKALTPDKDADAFGGVVDFKLAEAPSGGFKYNLRFQDGYNHQKNEFGQYKGSFAFSNRFIDERLGILITGNLEETQRGSDELNAGYGINREKRDGEKFAPIEASSVQFSRSSDIRKRFGFSILLDYEVDNNKFLLNTFLSRLDRDENIYERDFATGSNWQRYFWRDQRRKLNVLTTSLGGEHDFSFLRVDWKLSRSESDTRIPYSNIIQFKETSAFDQGLIPNRASLNDLINAANNNLDLAHLYRGDFQTEKSSEIDLSAQLNLESDFTITNWLTSNFKYGFKVKSKDKIRDRGLAVARLDTRNPAYKFHHTRKNDPGFNFQYQGATGRASIYNYIDPDFDNEDFLNGSYELGIGLDGDELNHLLDTYLLDSLYAFSALRDLDDYELKENIAAGYLMSEINFGQNITFIPGFRYEHTETEMTSRRGNVSGEISENDVEEPVIFDTSATAKYDNWFPMFHLRVKPADWFDIRLAYTESISRPRLTYLLPLVRIDGSSQSVTIGSPDLSPQTAVNYDAYLSFYTNEIGLLTVGGFYKNLKNLIYNRRGHKILDAEKEGYERNWQGLSLNSPENSPFKTDVYGFEIEWQTNFRWLPSPFDGIVLNINYTHLWSETRYPRSLVLTEQIDQFPFVEITVIDTFRTGDMINQPDDIANISIGYDYAGFSGRLSMLYQGKTLSGIGSRIELDSFTSDYLRWDLLLKYDFTKNIGIYFALHNFTNEPDESFRFIEKYITNNVFYSWTADIGMNIRLR